MTRILNTHIEQITNNIVDEIAKRISLNHNTISWSEKDKNSMRKIFIEFAKEIKRATIEDQW